MTFLIDPSPIALDPVMVRPTKTRVRGHVVAEGSGERLVGADVQLVPVGRTSTRPGGLFSFEQVNYRDSVLLLVSAFGYEPFQAALVAERDTTVIVELAVDSIAQRIIDQQVGRLENRSRESGYSLEVMSHQRIMETTLSTAYEVVRRRLGTNVGRTQCILVDDVRIGRIDELGAYPTELIERLEVVDRGRMIRIYTSRFIRRMVEGRIVLAPIVLIDGTNRPSCS